jgi:hypothetical protein
MLYVDGCSFMAAVGLPENYKLSCLLNADKDMSIEGKSNIQIIHDLHKHIDHYDTFVLSFTFSVRNVLFFDGKHPLQLLPNTPTNWYGSKQDFEQFKNFHSYYYRNVNLEFIDVVSDFYIDGAIALLKEFKKKYVIYTAEPRNSKFSNEIIQHSFIPENLDHDKHFNEKGMLSWAENVKKKLYE